MSRPESDDPSSPAYNLIWWAVIAYLLWGTGPVSDDFPDMALAGGATFPQSLVPTGNFLNVPVGHWSHHIWFRFFSLDHPWVIDLFKIGFTIVSFEMMSRFFKLYITDLNARLVTFLFIFYPSHDAIPYWYAPSGHLLSLAIYFYAFTLARAGRLKTAFVLALLASFMVYGSTPSALALFVLFASERKPREALVMLVPNALYICYFVTMSLVVSVTPSRVLEPITPLGYLKQFALQVATFVDAGMGPSLWMKIWYAYPQLSLPSIAVGLALAALALTKDGPSADRWNPGLVASLLTLLFGSFAIFAATGRYPQLAFNLGNRTTFWGSLLLAYLLVVIPKRRLARFIILGLMLFSILGISDHWKAWSLHQRTVISRIAANPDLRKVTNGKEVFFSGNQYSKYGPLDHIEFMSEDWVPRGVLQLTLPQPNIWGRTISGRFEFRDGYLWDKKTGSRTVVGDGILVYDSEADKLEKLAPERIKAYIAKLPEAKRHWIQLEDHGLVSWAKACAIFLMPRMRATL